MHWNLTQLSLLVISFNLQLRRLTYVKKRLTYVKKKVNLPYLPEYNAGPCVTTEPNLRLHFEKKRKQKTEEAVPYFFIGSVLPLNIKSH